ncbi:MAG: ABC transporter permease [Bacteroidales bacterium]|jgi:lipoprotein-releasing system permease protein|nr:ABC transporter permease [Bacteroidales bacterium]
MMSSLFFFMARGFSREKNGHFSRPVTRVAVTGVTIGLFTMIVACAVTAGYKQAIREKVISMGGHVRVVHYDNNYSYEPVPFSFQDANIAQWATTPGIEKIQYTATKAGIIKADRQVEGVVLKGVDTSFSWTHFSPSIVAGVPLSFADTIPSPDLLLSSKLSKKLNLTLGDKVRVFFVQDPPMQRSFTVCGIFETHLPDFDERFAIADLRHLRKLNQWDSTQIGSIEILIDDYNDMERVSATINQCLDYQLKAESIKETYPGIFEWIDLFDTNVVVLIAITMIVCIITMISIFFIIALEQTANIGILKTIGMKNRDILSIFMIMATRILFRGAFLGNVAALALCFLQQKFHFFKLNPDTYHVSYIPTLVQPLDIIFINAGVFVACLSILLIPAYYISKRISPVQAIRFD